MRVPFGVIFETIGKDTFSPRMDITVGKASLSAGAKITSSKLSSASSGMVDIDGNRVIRFVAGTRIILAEEM